MPWWRWEVSSRMGLLGGREAGGLGLAFGGGGGSGGGDADGGEGALTAFLSFEPNSEVWLTKAAPPANVAATTEMTSVGSSRARTAARGRAGAGASAPE